MYNFIWVNKPDKIKREITHNCGFKIPNIAIYNDSIKSTWIRRYLQGNCKWRVFFENQVNKEIVLNTGAEYITKCFKKSTNSFWKNTLMAWYKIYERENESNIEQKDMLEQPLWYYKIFKTKIVIKIIGITMAFIELET